MQSPSKAIVDTQFMEEMPCGEHAMAERLRKLGWDKTWQFFTHAIYLAKGETIGVTYYMPHIAPCEHKHFANRVAA